MKTDRRAASFQLAPQKQAPVAKQMANATPTAVLHSPEITDIEQWNNHVTSQTARLRNIITGLQSAV